MAATVLAAVTACGTTSESTGDGQTTREQPTTTPPTTTATSTTTTGAGTKCKAADLKGSMSSPNAGAGNRYADLVVTNTSGRPCTIYGYGGLQLIGADGRPTPTDLARTPDPGPTLVTLRPGGTAAKTLHWGVIPSGDEPVTGPCEPASTGARVIPPDDTKAFMVTFAFGSVCAGGHVDGSAYFKK
jgi:uncharacterized protein DUF4232